MTFDKEQYMTPLKKMYTVFIMVIFLSLLSSCINQPTNETDHPITLPVIEGVMDLDITIGTSFDPLDGIRATWNDIDITDVMIITGTVDVHTEGTYVLSYTVKNELGYSKTVSRTIKVIGIEKTPIESRFSIIEEIDDTYHHVTHIQAKGHVKNDLEVSSYQEVNVFKQDENVLVASWSKFSSGNYTRATTLDIAKDFELNHPNYEVIAAVNGDFFWTETISANVMFGNRTIKPDNDWQNFYQQVQFNRYGQKINVLDRATISTSLHLTLYDAQGSLTYYDDKVSINRTTLTSNETTILFSGAQHVYDPKATYFKLSSNKLHQVGAHTYFEGTVHEKITTLNATDLMIATKNTDLTFLLAANQSIIVQNITNEIGYNDMLIGIDAPIIKNHEVRAFSELNNQTQEQISRNTGRHPRTGFGFDQSGQMVLITVDGRSESKGVDLREFGHIMKHYGIVEGYNLDGGGSTQAVFRQNGMLAYVNTPSQQNRLVGNALLFIREKNQSPKYVVNINHQTLYFQLLDTHGIDEIIIKINGISHKFTDPATLVSLDIGHAQHHAISITYLKGSIPYVLHNDIIRTENKVVTQKVYIQDQSFQAIFDYQFTSNIGNIKDVVIFSKERWEEISEVVDHPNYNLTDFKMANMALAVTDSQGNVVAIRTYWKWTQAQYGYQFLKGDQGDIIVQDNAFNRNHLEVGLNALIPQGGYVFVFPTDLVYLDAIQFGINHLFGLNWDLYLGLVKNGDSTSFTHWNQLPINPFADDFKVLWSGQIID